MIMLDEKWLQAHPLPPLSGETDKNKRGRVLAAGGSRTVPGALLLTGEAAFRAGAGKVQLATLEEAQLALGIRLPEAAIYPLAVNAQGELAEHAGTALARMLDRCDALVLGPGMGPNSEAPELLRTLLAARESGVALLLDAASIGAAANLAEQARQWPGPLVMTPHPGEMAALLDCDAAEVTAAHAEDAAKRFDATIVLKRAESWIATPGEPVLNYAGGGAGLATGGSGDVLAGVIAGLMARGAEPHRAAAWGVWLHGEAGKRAAGRIGPIGFLARELLAEIPDLMGSA